MSMAARLREHGSNGLKTIMNKTILIRELGDASVLRYETSAIPALGPNDVLVRQEAIGVNFIDTMVRSGRYPAALPAVLGFEAAGVVEAVGSDHLPFRLGERVGYFFAPNAYANYNVVDASALVALPDDITTAQAAAFLAKGLTAWMGLRALHVLKAGESILVQGASGNVGSMVTRWARHLGATVIGVASSEQKLPAVAKVTTLALASSDAHFMDKVRALQPHGVDVVYDFVGGATFPSSLAAVRNDGKILTIGAAAGQPRIDRDEVAARSIQVRGGGTPQYVTPANQAAAAAELFAAIRQGIFDDIEVSKHSLKDASAVHDMMDTRRLVGIPVLFPEPNSNRLGA
jgi:NADPH2:quinone reductase